LVYFITIWSILRSLEIFYDHLVYFVVIWYVLPRFGILDQEKSGNPGGQNEATAGICKFVVERSLKMYL
jgi:hypothetical protein